jgi:hypothetical protein
MTSLRNLRATTAARGFGQSRASGRAGSSPLERNNVETGLPTRKGALRP